MISQTSERSHNSSDLILSNPIAERIVKIFSHPWHYIYKGIDDPAWKTEPDRALTPAKLWSFWQDARTLIGLRFGKLTRYAMLDIDARSPYHPDNDPSALPLIREALESIGVYRTILIRSSDSGGLHLYIPFDDELPSYGIAQAIKWCLSDAGFNLASGHLESFPNCKSWIKFGKVDYMGHRLPLQSGSFILNADYEVISDDLNQFLTMWQSAAGGNDMDELHQAIEIAKQRRKDTYQPSGSKSALEWQTDSERDIAFGFVSHGQTNDLLRIIGRYGIVFKHLSGDALVDYVIQTITACPGYEKWCRHQNEIETRSRQWAKECEKCYYPHGSRSDKSGNPWKAEREKMIEKVDRRKAINAQKTASAIERIKSAVASLDHVATSIGDLANKIAATAKCSLATLYRNRHLWHPEHTVKSPCNEPIAVDPAIDQPIVDTPLETLETTENQPLQAISYKKVKNRARTSEPDQPPPKTHSQPPPTPPGFDFGDRASPTDAQNHSLESDSGDRGKESLTSVDRSSCRVCCFEFDRLGCELEIAIGACPKNSSPSGGCSSGNADSDLARHFLKGDRCGEILQIHLIE